jgi:hypothetical protein
MEDEERSVKTIDLIRCTKTRIATKQGLPVLYTLLTISGDYLAERITTQLNQYKE